MEQHTLEKRWQALSQEVITGMAAWRLQHPKATLKAIEAALDERMERLRAKLLEEAALLRQARDWGERPEDAPRCPACGTALQRSTQGVRTVQTHGKQVIQ